MKRLGAVLKLANVRDFFDWRKSTKSFESDLVPAEPQPRKKSKRTRKARKHK